MNELTLASIKELIPHREPFLFVDEVVEIEPGVRLVAKRFFPETESFFRGHFPDYPIVPGVVLVEAMAQASGILAFMSLDVKKRAGVIPLFTGIEKARFRAPVRPNDTISIEVVLKYFKPSRMILKTSATVFIKENIASQADLLAMVKKA